MKEAAVVVNLGNQVGTPSTYGYPQFSINRLGLVGHLLVQFWVLGGKDDTELTIDPKEYHIIGCDEDESKQLLRYRSHFDSFTIITSYSGDDDVFPGGIARVFWNESPEMSPNISYYSKEEYPHRDFALTCGILSSFCFPFYIPKTCTHGVLEIVSTCNQDVATLRKFCQSFKGLNWYFSFQGKIGNQEYTVPEINHFLKVVCQTFHLPLCQYWNGVDLVDQFSYKDFETSAPWCQFKDACLCTCIGEGTGPLGHSCEENGAYFCRDIAALSIIKYPFAHYARNCGSVACLTIYLRHISKPYSELIIQFFIPAQQIDNDYPQNFFNSLWATIKECLPNHMLASGEQLEQGFSVQVIKSESSTYNEPTSFEVGQPHSSLPHHGGSESESNSTEQTSNSSSYKEAATEETSKTIPNEASQPRRSEGYFETKGKAMVFERVNEPVEDARYARSNVDNGCGTSIVDIRNAVATAASQPSRFQTNVTLHHQVEETMVLENERDASQQLPNNLQPLFEYGAEQDKQVLEIIRSTLNSSSYEEISTVATSKRTPDDVEQIICLDELEEESPIKCIEPQSLTSQARRSEEIFRNVGYTVASERVDTLVEVSPDDDIAVTPASKRLENSEILWTKENISKHFGRPLKDAAESFGVSPSTFKRKCRDAGIKRWPHGKRKLIDDETGKKNFSSSMPSLQDTPVVSHRSQELEKMTVKATYNGVTIKFELNTLSGISELEDSVIKRLHLERNSFSIKYQDSDGELILIGCDEDVQEFMKFSRSAEKTPIKMLIHPPVNHYAP